MKKVEAPTLEEAYRVAASQLECSVTDLQYEVVQYPSKGILGFLKKNAIIVATCKKDVLQQTLDVNDAYHVTEEMEVKITFADEVMSAIEEEDQTAENFTENEDDQITQKSEIEEDDADEEVIVYQELAELIESQLKELLSHSCFDIDVVEVDVRNNTALIFIDGEDAALLIGKEGYRYNALSYMLFNWLHSKYELYIKLEIAEFLTTQQEMIRNYIKPVIENVRKHGRGRTLALDGILVQIALEQLREVFPDKYVAVKVDREGNRFIVINDFNVKKNG